MCVCLFVTLCLSNSELWHEDMCSIILCVDTTCIWVASRHWPLWLRGNSPDNNWIRGPMGWGTVVLKYETETSWHRLDTYPYCPAQYHFAVPTDLTWSLHKTIFLSASKKLYNYIKKFRGLSPQSDYTDRANSLAAKLMPTLADGRCHVVSVKDPYGHILGFLDRSPYFFLQVASQLYSRGWVDPVPDPLLLRKCGSAGNRTRISGSEARNSIVAATDDMWWVWSIGGMSFGGNRRALRKSALLPVCATQIPHDLTWALTRATAFGMRPLTALTAARPKSTLNLFNLFTLFRWLSPGTAFPSRGLSCVIRQFWCGFVAFAVPWKILVSGIKLLHPNVCSYKSRHIWHYSL
jgi:hypothetical protein